MMFKCSRAVVLLVAIGMGLATGPAGQAATDAEEAERLCDDAKNNAALMDYARRWAAKIAKEKNVPYESALRLALERASRFVESCNKSDRTTAVVELHKPPESIPVLEIDKDPRYLAWLRRLPLTSKLVIEDKEFGTRNIGGNRPQDESTFADVVALLKTLAEPYCSGIALSQRVVLTAAHCRCLDPKEVRPGIDPMTLKPIFKVDRASGHSYAPPAANCLTQESRFGRDYALIRLKDPIGDEKLPAIATLATPEMIKGLRSGDSMYVVGYGKTQVNGRPGSKNFILTPVISPNCTATIDSKYGCVAGREIVSVDPRMYPGPCGGDSGGAAFIVKNERLYLVGVVSRSIRNGKCGDGAIYTLLAPTILAELKAEQQRLEALP